MDIKQRRRFVRQCAEIGVNYHRWGWNQRIGWAAEELAGSHTYKGVRIPNYDLALQLIERGTQIAARAEIREQSLQHGRLQHEPPIPNPPGQAAGGPG